MSLVTTYDVKLTSHMVSKILSVQHLGVMTMTV